MGLNKPPCMVVTSKPPNWLKAYLRLRGSSMVYRVHGNDDES